MKKISNPQWSTSVKIKIRGVFTVYIVRLTLRLCTPCHMVVYAVSYALEGTTGECYVPCDGSICSPSGGHHGHHKNDGMQSAGVCLLGKNKSGRTENPCSVSSVNLTVRAARLLGCQTERV